MIKKLLTKISSFKEEKHISHPFLPALALKIAFFEGLNPPPKEIVNRIVGDLKKYMENGYAKWDESYPPDYDFTIVARDILISVGKPIEDKLDLGFSKEGGVYTYKGGIEEKRTNSVDLLINLIIFKHLKTNNINKQDEVKIKEFIIKNKEKFKENIGDISKYYLSEGFLLYCLSKVAKELDIDLDKLIKLKIDKITNKTDLAFVILASSKIFSKVIEKYQISKEDGLKLFQEPSKKRNFSCPFFDEMVRKSAELKIAKKQTIR